MLNTTKKSYFFYSFLFHIVIFLVLILGFHLSSPLPVLENTNQRDVISAVALGDTKDSKILPQQLAARPIKPVEKPEKPIEKPQKLLEQMQKDVIALQEKNKKLAEKKALEEKQKQHDMLTKDFLSDLKKMTAKQKKLKQNMLKAQFEKTLRESAEKTLRQQLLNEEIRLQGKQNRQAQGEVNKYKALILQAISEHWLIPAGADKKLYCELLIRVAPGGMVLDVQVTKGSGDPALDSSARAAVLKASPLPVPENREAFAAFRQFVLKVKPENILAEGIAG